MAASAPPGDAPLFQGVMSSENTPDASSSGTAGKGDGPDAYVGLTYDKLDVGRYIDRVRNKKSGAVVVFIGTTRDNFEGKEVQTLEYSTYPALALKSLRVITSGILETYKDKVHAISIVHRLGIVPVGEDSIVIALSSSHRQEGWRAAEEALENTKDKVEIWKKEWFADGGVWRANKDGQRGEMEVTGRSSIEILEQEDR